MPDTQSLGSQLKDDLLNNLSVSSTAVFLAVLALAGVTTSDQVDGGLFLALNLAVFLPWAYDTYWPVEYNPIPAVVWTVSAVLVTTGLYLGSYVLFERLVSPEFVKAAAFTVTVVLQYGIPRLYATIRNAA